MTKAEIVNEISKQTGIKKEECLAIVEAFMDVTKETMCNGESVYLRGFGSFIIKTRAPKPARNISKQETILLPERKKPCFKPAKVFLESVSKVPLQE